MKYFEQQVKKQQLFLWT